MPVPFSRNLQKIVEDSGDGAQHQTPAQPGRGDCRSHPSSRRQPESRGSS